MQRGEFNGVPYLRDESQEVARGYDAKTTPDVFLLDSGGVLRYRGAPDADYEDPSQNAAWLRAGDRRGARRSHPGSPGDDPGRLLRQVESLRRLAVHPGGGSLPEGQVLRAGGISVDGSTILRGALGAVRLNGPGTGRAPAVPCADARPP